MPATTTVTKIACNILVNNGTTQTGAIKTATVSLGSINKDAFDADKAYAIAEVVATCLTKALYDIRKVETSSINV